MQMSLTSGGHSTAAMRAISYFSDTGCISELTSGITFYKFVENLEKNFETEKDEFSKKLKETMGYIFTRDNIIVGITAQKEGLENLE